MPTVPPLVIVVGIANVYAWVTYVLGDSALTLTFASAAPVDVTATVDLPALTDSGHAAH